MALNHKTTKEDMETRMGIPPTAPVMTFRSPFIYDGKKYEGFTDEMNPRKRFRRLDSNLTSPPSPPISTASKSAWNT